MTTKKIISITLIALLILSVLAATIATAAYLTSRRTAQGYINFATGIEIEYKNVSDNSSGYGNLYYLNTQTEENESLQLSNVEPNAQIKLANPTLKPQEGTANFALRAKLVITATDANGNEVVFDNNEEYANLTETTSQDATKVVFASGVIAFNSAWQYNAEDGYYYYATSGSSDLADRIIEVDENNGEITVFNTDSVASEYLTLSTSDEPIEAPNYAALAFELHLEAIQYSRLDVWNLD